MSCHAALKLRDKATKVKVRDVYDFRSTIDEFLRLHPFARKSDIVNPVFCCRIFDCCDDILAKA